MITVSAACLRINPGNIGGADRVKEVVKAAKANGCSIRIGVNGGSLDKRLLEKYGEPTADAMVESALEQAKMLEDNDFRFCFPIPLLEEMQENNQIEQNPGWNML